MAPTSFAVDGIWRAGHLLAGFNSSRDADLAELVLLDRGVASESVCRLSAAEMAPHSEEAAGVNSDAAGHPDRAVADRRRERHWLVIPVDDDADAAIFAEYVTACGAVRIYGKFCSIEGQVQASACVAGRRARTV